MAKGRYRYKRENGDEWVALDEPNPATGIELDVSRDTYILRNYQPVFNKT